MTKRILLTCEDFLPVIGGAEICVANLRSQLTKRGYTVTIFTNTTKKMADNADEQGIIRLQWIFNIKTVFKHISVLWSLIRKQNVVHCQYSFRLAALCGVLCRIQGIPMILTQQGKGIVPEANTRWHNLPFVILCRWISLLTASRVTSTSNEITDLTSAYVKRKKIVLITNGYDSERFSPNTSLSIPAAYAQYVPRVPIILTVRRLVPKNGIHILVQALARLRDKGVPFHYFAIGEGRARPSIEVLIDKFQLQSHVTLLSKLDNSLLPNYYQYATVIVIPSSAEATSIACIEALGMKKVIVASRVGGLIDLLDKPEPLGILVDIYGSEKCSYDPPETVSEERLNNLTTALEAALTTTTLTAMAERGMETAQSRYAWSEIVNQYETQYRDISHSLRNP